MMIEQNTNYAYKLKYMDNPNFDKVRDLSTKFYRELPQALQDELFEALNRGIDILDSEPQMTAYLFAFGKMHQAKLNYAFDKLPKEFFEQPEINIIDYGCGQALGTMCYADFLRENGHEQKIKTITLIEPSEMCLKRAALHVSAFFPNAVIKTVNKPFDELVEDDIYCDEGIPTLHILSNVLDMLCFDLGKFANFEKDRLKGYNQFVCVGPFFNYSVKDERMNDFASLLDCEGEYREVFDKYEFDPEKTWTAQILYFSIGKLSGEMKGEILSTEVIEEDLGEAIEDEYGVLYSKDGKRLLKCKNKSIKSYNVRQGTRIICDRAFLSVDRLKQVIIPRSVTKIEDQAFCGCKSLQKIDIPDSVTSIGYNVFGLCESLQRITIPDSVTFLGPTTFHKCISLQQVTISSSLAHIDYMTFCECNSLQQIVIPDSITVIGDWAFSECSSLKQIIIPDSVTYIGEGAFSRCVSLQQVTLSGLLCSVGPFAFEKCQSIKRIVCPESVTRIYAGAFSECVSLQQISISNSAVEIGDEIFHENVFKNCRSIQQIVIPKGSIEKFKEMLDEELWDKLVEQ